MSDIHFNTQDVGEAWGAREGEEMRIPVEPVYQVFRPIGQVEFVTVNDREFVRFGLTGLFGYLLLDRAESRVVMQIEGNSELSLVNTSLPAFNRCLEALVEVVSIAGGGDDDELDDDNVIAEEFERKVLDIDPEAYAGGSFWYDIRWDIANGDFSD